MKLVRLWSEAPVPEIPEWLDHAYSYPSFSDFGKVMHLTWRGPCNSLERLDQASSLIYSSLHAQNVRYLEMSIGIGAYPYPVHETLDAFRSNIPDGMTVRIIGGLSRDRNLEVIHPAGLAYIRAEGLDGVDLHGLESVGDPSAFRDLYDIARSRGLILKAHAGEFGGPESVEEVLDKLGVDRIQHGVRGIESDRLVQRYVEDSITLDLCPWSNVKLGVYGSLEDHPVGRLHRAGVRVTVSTDDPTPFGQTISEEYAWLITKCGLTVREAADIARNGFEVARISAAERDRAVVEIEALVEEYGDERRG